MSFIRAICTLIVLLLWVAPSHAEMVGHFEIGDCTEDGCHVLTPGTGEPMEWRLSKKELAVANKAYDTLVDADRRLEARGFADVARVAFAHSTFYQLTPDGWITEVVLDTFLRNVHQNTFDEVSNAYYTYHLPWVPIAAIANHVEFHPTTGEKLSTGSIKSRAQSLPDCFKNGDPAMDCRPIRYMGDCLLSPADQELYANDPSEWVAWEQADLGTIMTAEQESQLDLSTAKVVESAPRKAPEKPKKSADNPAGRPLCDY